MTDPSTHFHAFADAEQDARIATWSEEDEDAYYDRLGAFFRLIAKPLRTSLNPAGRFFAEDEEFKGPKVEGELADIRRRTLFAFTSWQDPERGTMATALFGPNTPKLDDRIYQRFHLALALDPPQIVGYEVSCSTCKGTGQRPGAPCEDCGGRGFQPRGSSLALTGDPRSGELQVVEQPEDERSQAILAAHGA